MKWIYNFKIALSLTTLCVFIMSCASKQEKFLNNFESFILETEQNATSYSSNDWEAVDAQFERFMTEEQEIVEKELTSEQKKKVGELTARYYKVRAKSYGESLIDAIEDGLDYIEGFANGILNDNNDKNNE